MEIVINTDRFIIEKIFFDEKNQYHFTFFVCNGIRKMINLNKLDSDLIEYNCSIC